MSCLHCTVSSAYTSVHNLATHMCHLPYNCHLHSQWARLRHAKVACHIHVSFASALTETRRSGSLFLFYFTVSVRCMCTELVTAAHTCCHTHMTGHISNQLRPASPPPQSCSRRSAYHTLGGELLEYMALSERPHCTCLTRSHAPHQSNPGYV